MLQKAACQGSTGGWIVALLLLSGCCCKCYPCVLNHLQQHIAVHSLQPVAERQCMSPACHLHSSSVVAGYPRERNPTLVIVCCSIRVSRVPLCSRVTFCARPAGMLLYSLLVLQHMYTYIHAAGLCACISVTCPTFSSRHPAAVVAWLDQV